MKLLIAGAGGHGRVVADAASAVGAWSEIAFLDDRYPALGAVDEWRVAGTLADLERIAPGFDALLAGFGDSALRLQTIARALKAGVEVPVLVHPRAFVSPRAKLAQGTVVIAGGVVNIGARSGVGCIINSGATVDHDCQLGDGVHVCPGVHLAGNVVVGSRTWIGIGAVVRQGIRLGSDVTVAAGAVCVADVRDAVTVLGVPAKEIQR